MSDAPRVTPFDIEMAIINEHYFTAGQGANASEHPVPDFSPLHLLTFCVLTLRNGFTVTGESACVSAANFNQDMGRRIAREKAVEKIWPLLGYALRDKLHTTEMADRTLREITSL